VPPSYYREDNMDKIFERTIGTRIDSRPATVIV